MRKHLLLLVAALSLWGAPLFAQATATAVPNTPTPTRTPNPSLQGTPGTRMSTARLHQLTDFVGVGGKTGRLAELLTLSLRQVKATATNETALGLRDIGTVTSIMAFTRSSGAAATKTLLTQPTDYTVANGDITPVGDHSLETWVITYRP